MMNQKEDMIIVTLDLKRPWEDQIYVIIVIHVKGTITFPNTAVAGVAVNDTNKKVMFKSCTPLTDFITETNNTQVDGAQKIDVVIPKYDL